MNNPVVYCIKDSADELNRLEEQMDRLDAGVSTLLFRFPTVYIHSLGRSGLYDVYIGETNNILQRTRQHIETGRTGENWQSGMIGKEGAKLFIIGHEHFNKSLTLDMENRLMMYMTGMPNVRRIHNLRGNEQSQYYPADELKEIFRRTWEELRSRDSALFLSQREIEDSAIFKASPFHKLTAQQREAKENILAAVDRALEDRAVGELVFVEGEAGTGKTVLNSNLFYELTTLHTYENRNLECYLLVNHDQQLVVYQQIAAKLGIFGKEKNTVSKPTSFINSHPEGELADVIVVDEAHLLWTQGKQSYKGSNQLEDLRRRLDGYRRQLGKTVEPADTGVPGGEAEEQGAGVGRAGENDRGGRIDLYHSGIRSELRRRDSRALRAVQEQQGCCRSVHEL